MHEVRGLPRPGLRYTGAASPGYWARKEVATEVFERILVPLDGTEGTARALPVAKEIAAHFGGRLHLLEVVPPTVDRNHLQYIAAPDALDAEDVAVHAAHRHLQHVAASLRGTPVECDVRIGQPADAIRKAAEDDGCDLICMAAGGAGDRVSRNARVPVLLVRPAR